MSKNTNATTAKSEKTELVFTVKQLRRFKAVRSNCQHI